MKLISLNVELNKHNQPILEFFKKENPDIICVQELLEEDFTFYKKELNMDGIYQSTRYVRSLNYEESIGKRQGVAIFAKNIIERGSIFYIGNEEGVLNFDPVNFNDGEALVWVDIKNTDETVFKFTTAHLPVTKEGESTPYQLKALDALFEKLEPLGEFTLCGDMNAPRGNETFNRFAKKFKDNIPLEYKTSIDQNLHRNKNNNLQYMVDCLFTTSKYKASDVKLVDGLSDHMAIVANIGKI